MKASLPLAGVKVLELQGIGPVPHASSILAMLGADVTVVRNPVGVQSFASWHRLYDVNKARIDLDLKNPQDVESFLGLASRSDVIIDGMRPGVVDRLGVGPDQSHLRNRSLIYAHVTGWGQTGGLSKDPGHDINYLALSGVLWEITPPGAVPRAPLNLLADFAGGAMQAVVAILSSLLIDRTQRDRIVLDVAMVDGAASLLTMHASMNKEPTNALRDGAPFYGVYACEQPNTYVAVGALEDKFYSNLLRMLGAEDEACLDRWDPANWDVLKARFAACFKRKTRDYWASLPASTAACVTPVFSLEESSRNSHMLDRIGIHRSARSPRGDIHPVVVEERSDFESGKKPPLTDSHARGIGDLVRI